jgi:hypothetical protein
MFNLLFFILRILNFVFFGRNSVILESAFFKKCNSTGVPDAGAKAFYIMYIRAVEE